MRAAPLLHGITIHRCGRESQTRRYPESLRCEGAPRMLLRRQEARTHSRRKRVRAMRDGFRPEREVLAPLPRRADLGAPGARYSLVKAAPWGGRAVLFTSLAWLACSLRQADSESPWSQIGFGRGAAPRPALDCLIGRAIGRKTGFQPRFARPCLSWSRSNGIRGPLPIMSRHRGFKRTSPIERG
jgi:hypothetical protein